MAMEPVGGIESLRAGRVGFDPTRPLPARSAQPQAPASFRDFLFESLGAVQRLQDEADTSIKQIVSGEVKDVTQAMVAVERADIAFQTMMQVRNRLVAAYEEVMRMQV